jgi:hypothetical protein
MDTSLMPNILRPDLINADSPEVAEHLVSKGFIQTEVSLTPEGLKITVLDAADEEAIQSAMSDFIATASIGQYRESLPLPVRTEASRIKTSANRTDAQLDSAFPAGPQRELAYTMRAVCRALIYLVDNRLAD